MQKINREDLNSEQLPDWAEFERTAEDETVIRAKSGFKNYADQADLADEATHAIAADTATTADYATTADPPFVTFVGSGATRKELTLEDGTLSLYDYPEGGSRGALLSSLAYDSTAGKLLAKGIQEAIEFDTVDILSSTLTAGKIRGASALSGGKMFLPSYNAADMDVVTLSTMAKTAVALTTAQNYDAVGVIDGAYIYFAPSTGTRMLRVTIANNAVAEYNVLSNHVRYSACGAGGKVYLPQSGGTNMDIYDTTNNTKTTVAGFTSGDKFICFHYNGKIYMPLNASTTMDIYDIATGAKTTAVIGNAARYAYGVYGTNVFMPIASGATMYIFDLLTNTETSSASLINIGTRSDAVVFGKYLVMAQNPGVNLEFYNMETRVDTYRNYLRNYTKYTICADATTIYIPESSGTRCDRFTLSTRYRDISTAQSGTNWNGSFVRFNNGLQICWFRSGAVGAGVVSYYLPAAFIDTVAGLGGAITPFVSYQPFYGYINTVDLITINNTVANNGFQYIAIGWWK